MVSFTELRKTIEDSSQVERQSIETLQSKVTELNNRVGELKSMGQVLSIRMTEIGEQISVFEYKVHILI